MDKNRAKRQSFLVNILYREHNSWQGTMTHAETGEEITFRSALEMMMRMNEWLETNENNISVVSEHPYDRRSNIRVSNAAIV